MATATMKYVHCKVDM